ncbi:hypothetical protein QEN19_002398 [Hanseniaspora menglaensis]
MSEEHQNLDENNVFNDFMKEDEENDANTIAENNAVLAVGDQVKNRDQQAQIQSDDKEYGISSVVEAAAAVIASANEDNKIMKQDVSQEEENYKKIDFEKNEDLINVLGDKNSIEASAEAIIEMNGGVGKKRKVDSMMQKKDDANKKRRKRKVLSCLRCRKDKQACTRTFPCTRCIKKEFVCKFVDNITGIEFFPQTQENSDSAAIAVENTVGKDAEHAIVSSSHPTEEDNLLNIDESLGESKEHKVDEESAEQIVVQNIAQMANAQKVVGEDHENILSVIDSDLKDE